MIYLAYRVSTHHHYGESSSETHEHLIDADADLRALTERVNEHFALPSTIRGERGTKHEIPLLAMHSVPTYMPGGGGTDYTAHIEIRGQAAHLRRFLRLAPKKTGCSAPN